MTLSGAPRVDLANPVRVLMVDDDRDDYVLLERMLRRVEVEYRVEWVPDARTGLEAVLRQEHDVYLVDQKLGSDEGLDLILKCRTAGCDRPMILLTGHEAPRFDEYSMEHGAADYLSKNSIDHSAVDQSIRHALARWRLERQLDSLEHRFRRAFEASPVGMILTDTKRTVVDTNDAFSRLVGRPPGELVGAQLDDLFEVLGGMSIRSIFPSDDDLVDDPSRASTFISSMDGLMRYVELVVATLDRRANDVSHIVQVVDFTELRMARERLEELVRTKDEFLASISHELRTPLTAVLGFAALLLENENLGAGERDELLRTVHQQSLELSNIIEDLLVAARADTGELQVVPEVVDLGQQVDDVVAAFVLSGTPRPDFSGTRCDAIVDPIRFRQIIRNLFTNALRFGGPNVTIELQPRGPMAVVRVIDDGPGPDPSITSSIFDPYVHVRNETSTPSSIGLGLAVSRHLAQLMGGDLEYLREGGHTVFELTAPLA